MHTNRRDSMLGRQSTEGPRQRASNEAFRLRE